MVFWQNKETYLDITNGIIKAKVMLVLNESKSGTVAYLMNSNGIGSENKKMVYSDDAILAWVPIKKKSDIEEAYKLIYVPGGKK